MEDQRVGMVYTGDGSQGEWRPIVLFPHWAIAVEGDAFVRSERCYEDVGLGGLGGGSPGGLPRK